MDATLDSDPVPVHHSGVVRHALTLLLGALAALAAVGSPLGLVPAMGFLAVLGTGVGWAPGWVASALADGAILVIGAVVTAVVGGWIAVAGGVGFELCSLVWGPMHGPARAAYLTSIGLELLPWALVGGWFAVTFAAAG